MSTIKDKDGDVIMTSEKTSSGNADEVDEKLYSRQLYVMGIEAMKQMQHSKVLIVGMNGIGVEIGNKILEFRMMQNFFVVFVPEQFQLKFTLDYKITNKNEQRKM
ncbi:hypothetical protein RFI_10273 [Reticulomyxa filosa]|uniref:Uncharacterized protein n=1 Tax=Reticulomyxa filosa TaxID=46433 RepID=X6NLV6_RETFI|nr:hypothetical protein RFI_10273 [Reticulomyxa filosa]|eukprot:ETO26863.1 hypothetical protein RFI_10273 [Reticulomyxa filosa]